MQADPATAPYSEAATDQPAVELRGLVKEFRDRRSGRHGEVVRAVDDVNLRVADGEFFALLGPSGCGKTTTLRVIAGFETPTSGEVLLHGRPVHGIPPFHRPVNTVFQDYALFPHMSVLDNVLFGLRMSRVPAAEAKRRAFEALELVQLRNVARRRPDQLSGGQRQRVALARALVNRPEVLLLDEPLGALDLKLRKAMQFELKTLQQQVGITFIYVTHDQEEALTMADRIAVMHAGKTLQIGTPEEIYERPQSRFVADFIGETNFLSGTLHAIHGDQATVTVGSAKVTAAVRAPGLTPGNTVTVAVRPEKLDLARRDDNDATPAPPTALPGIIAEVHYLGTDTRYRVRFEAGFSMVARIQNQHHGYAARYRVGEEVLAWWDAEHASVLD